LPFGGRDSPAGELVAPRRGALGYAGAVMVSSRWLVAIVLFAASGLAFAADGNAKLRLALASSHAAQGRHRQAMAAYREVLDEHPNHHRARLGLLEAMAEVSLCGEAEAEALKLEGTWYDNGKAHLALARCAMAVGAWDDAQRQYQLAWSFDDDEAEVAVEAADLAFRLGDPVGAYRWLDLARNGEGGVGLAALGEVRGAFSERRRDADRMLAELRMQFAGHPKVRSAMPLLNARMELGAQPCAAYVAILRSSLADVEHASYLAECLRRTGDPDSALGALSRPALGVKRWQPLPIAIRARVEVDLGDLPAARSTLAGADLRDAETLSSAWYLAQATDPDGAAARALAERWREHPVLALRDPATLFPSEE